MLYLKLKNLVQKIEEKTSQNPYTQIYGLARSMLALATLSVFIFNDFDYIFDKESLDIISLSNFLFNKINLFGIIGYDYIIWTKAISICVLIFVIFGYYPQVTGLLHFWITYSFHNSCVLLDGGDQIAVILTFFILPLTLLDKRKNHWFLEKNQSTTSKLIGHIIFILISLQVSFIYFHTAVEKLYKLSEWKDGTAIYYIFNNNYFGLSNVFLNIIKPVINSNFVLFLTWWVLISHLFLSYLLLLPRKNKILYFRPIISSFYSDTYGTL